MKWKKWKVCNKPRVLLRSGQIICSSKCSWFLFFSTEVTQTLRKLDEEDEESSISLNLRGQGRPEKAQKDDFPQKVRDEFKFRWNNFAVLKFLASEWFFIFVLLHVYLLFPLILYVHLLLFIFVIFIVIFVLLVFWETLLLPCRFQCSPPCRVPRQIIPFN